MPKVKIFSIIKEEKYGKWNKKVDRLPITDDYIFKRVFAFEGNESALKDLLEAILKKDIKTVTIKSRNNTIRKRWKTRTFRYKSRNRRWNYFGYRNANGRWENTDERGTQYLGKMITEQLKRR